MYTKAFVTLAIAGAVLLQGMLAIDGGLAAILKTIYRGRFPSNKPMAMVYTGLPVVDHFASVQVAFWTPVVSVGGIPRLQACMLCASLQTAGVWALIESLRGGKSSRHWIVKWAVAYVFLWQGVGTAIFLPLYLFVELDSYLSHPLSNNLDPCIPEENAIAILPAALLALVQPFVLVFFPPSGVTDSQHQTFLAAYQFGPIMCHVIIQAISSSLLKSGSSAKALEAKSDSKKDALLVKTTYVVFGILSAAVHLNCIYTVSSSSTISSSGLNIPAHGAASNLAPRVYNLFVPSFSSVWTASEENLMTQASLFFLQWDFIICALASAIYCAATSQIFRLFRLGNSAETSFLMLAFLAANFALGPGFTVSMVLFLRESPLRESFDMQRDSGASVIGGVRRKEE